jgi:hypothetical protein
MMREKMRSGSGDPKSIFLEEIVGCDGLIPISKSQPQDVFIVGYPKSGNTWMQHLICGAVYGMDLERTPDSLVQDLVPDVHSRQFYRRHREAMFFKTHFLPQPEYRRVILLLRDGRDVMVSYFHHLKASLGETLDFLEMVEHGTELFPCHWHEHVDAWRRNPYGADLITVRYEDLKLDPIAQLRRICAFAGVPAEGADLERAVQTSSFQAMQSKEARWGWDSARKWPRDRKFVRRGVVGSHNDEMPPQIRNSFLRKASETLQAVGYLDMDWPIPSET